MILQLRGIYYFLGARDMYLSLGCVFACPKVDIIFSAYGTSSLTLLTAFASLAPFLY